MSRDDQTGDAPSNSSVAPLKNELAQVLADTTWRNLGAPWTVRPFR